MIPEQRKRDITQYYGIVRVVLIVLIIGHVLSIITTIIDYNKPMDEKTVEWLNSREYKNISIISTIVYIAMYTMFYKIVSTNISAR